MDLAAVAGCWPAWVAALEEVWLHRGMKALCCALFCALAVGCVVRAGKPVSTLQTTAEQTDYVSTGDYAEVLRWCRELPEVFPSRARCDEIGRTSQGRPLLAMVVSPSGALTPQEARAKGHPVLLVQAGIHSGEIEGKDAGLAFLRDYLAGKLGAASATVVFVPVLNPDGHERRTANNRPNQRGPREMGFRTNGQNQNLNRDWAKADTSEVRAVLALMKRWDPDLFVDLHTTDGAKFEHDLAVMVSPQAPRADGLDEIARRLSDGVQAELSAQGHLPLAFYPSFLTEDDPLSGFAAGDAPPRFSTPYAGERGRLGVLVETHSWRTYRERLWSTYHTLRALLGLAQRDAAVWRQTYEAVDRETASLAGREVPLLWRHTEKARRLAFRGYRFEKVTSEISGAPWLRYDEKVPQVWEVPLYEELVPAMSVRAPARGYVVHGGHAERVRPVLEAHGIEYVELSGGETATVEVFRAEKVEFEPPYEGRQRAKLEGRWRAKHRTLDAGSIYVPISQRRARLILHLLEPTAPDSFAAWGFFNEVFEQKEYMEPYVAEEIAREMLARDPSLRAAFAAALAVDPELAKSPARRLDFFYRRHPSWDERKDLVPVFRLQHETPSIEQAKR